MADITVAEQRTAFIASLRAFADFLEAHPDVVFPRYTTLNAFVETREQLAAQARAASSWDKVYNGVWFSLEKQFGPELSFQINVPRQEVCRKVVTGKRIQPAQPEQEIEEFTWVCDEPLL